MEYPQQAWLAFFVSILSAYILGVWSQSVWSMSYSPPTGEGSGTQKGFYCREENGKPYNSGDCRAGK